MTLKQRLMIYIALGVQVFGHVRCSPDKTTQADTPAWSVGDIHFLRAGQQLKLHQAQNELTHYRLDDQILFSVPHNIQVRIQSDCFSDKMKITQHQWHESLRSQYFIFELLPPAYFGNWAANKNKTPPTCQFQFLASNTQGDTHRFQIHPMPVYNQSENLIRIRHANKPLQRKTAEVPFIVYERDWSLYTFDVNHHAHMQLMCEFHQGKFQAPAGAHLLANFNMERRDDLAPTNPIPPIQLCRIVASNNQGRVLEISDEFYLQSQVPGPFLRPLTEAKEIYEYSQEFIFREYEIHNPTEKELYLSIEKNLIQALDIAVYGARNRRKTYVTPGNMSLQVRLVGATTFTHASEWRWTMAPFSRAHLTIFHPNPRYVCKRPYRANSFHFQLSNLNILTLKQLIQIDGESARGNWAAEIPLEQVITRQFAAKSDPFSPISGSPGRKPTPPPKPQPPSTAAPDPTLCQIQ